ncbi:MAG: hypothetical protein ABJ364_08390, partial [Lentilitoribacter sp.]
MRIVNRQNGVVSRSDRVEILNHAQKAQTKGPKNMSSILTNNSAMVALQTLKSVNSNLADT